MRIESKVITKLHESVLLKEVLDALGLTDLARSNNQVRKFIDATLGTGGHTIEILKRAGVILGIETDETLLRLARQRIEKVLGLVGGRFKPVHGNFKDIYEIGKHEGFLQVDGILFDLGVSNLHFEDPERGFSFKYENAPLDMRLNGELQNVTGSDLLNNLRHDQLTTLFSVILSKYQSKKLAESVVSKRIKSKFATVGDFLSIFGKSGFKNKLHPATLPLLALRIAVNSELDNLKEALPSSLKLLRIGGNLVVISFHSAEDRIVKRFFKLKAKEGVGEIITKKPIVVQAEEILLNPKARSAKLRILKKI